MLYYMNRKTILIAFLAWEACSLGLDRAFISIHYMTLFRSATTLQGLDLIFQMIVEDKEPSWQFTMGRLVALERVLTLMKVDTSQAGIALDFSLHNLTNGHCRVAKMALKVFVLSAKLLTLSEPSDFEQVWKLILTLPDPTLQLTLRKKLKIALR